MLQFQATILMIPQSNLKVDRMAWFGEHQTVKEGPDISIVAALIGDPARANMLMALMSGLALSGTELAAEAGVTLSTASGHLGKLEKTGLVIARKQGRTHYFRLADPDVAAAVEGLIPIATRVGHLRMRPGPRDQAMRQARSCYDHLAGRLAVALLEHWLARKVLREADGALQLTPVGRGRLKRLGIEIAALEQSKRPLCRTCIDWSERRRHLGGALGAAALDHLLDHRWAVREGRSRVLRFSPSGEQSFVRWYSAA
jgi:DNA-binding transcriptional ArsR family regulator